MGNIRAFPSGTWSTRQPTTGGSPTGAGRHLLDCPDRAPWRDLPAEFGNWNSVWRQFRRWAQSGIWDVMLEGFADSGGDTDMLQMIDSSVIRAHRCAAGIKGGLGIRRWGVRGVDFPAKSTCA